MIEKYRKEREAMQFDRHAKITTSGGHLSGSQRILNAFKQAPNPTSIDLPRRR